MRTTAGFFIWDGVNSGTNVNCEGSGWRAALQKGIWVCLLTVAQYESAVCPGSQEGKPHPGVHQTQSNQPVKRGVYPAVFTVGSASSLWVLCAGLCPTIGLACLERRAAKLVEGLEGMSCEEQLRTLGSPNLERRWPRNDLMALYGFLRRWSGEAGADLFSLIPTDRTRGKGSQLCQEWF